MERYSLLFTFKEVIYGKGFLALVVARGRALMAQEYDKWWLYGVQPGGMADSGQEIFEAQLNFRAAFKNILLDFAAESENFKEFEKAAKGFFNTIDAEDEKEWIKAREAIRSGKVKAPSELCTLKKETGDFDSTINIILLDKNAKFAMKKNDNLPKKDVTLPPYAAAA
jgi:hypothetical protein